MNEFEPCGTFRDLTRPELDELLLRSQLAFNESHKALAQAPLMPEIIAGQAGVAQDCLVLWQACLNESIWRLWHGEPVTHV